MVIGEAMASGLPVMCSTSSAGPELIENGQHGFTYNPYNRTELAEKIDWCYRHPDELVAMGKQGQHRIRAYSWDSYGHNIYQVYTAILEGTV